MTSKKLLSEAHERVWKIGWKQTKEDYIAYILPKLYGIKANIPLTPDTGARKQIEALIKELEGNNEEA